MGLMLLRLFIFGDQIDYFVAFGWNALWVLLLSVWGLVSATVVFGILAFSRRLKMEPSTTENKNHYNSNHIEMDEVMGREGMFLTHRK